MVWCATRLVWYRSLFSLGVLSVGTLVPTVNVAQTPPPPRDTIQPIVTPQSDPNRDRFPQPAAPVQAPPQLPQPLPTPTPIETTPSTPSGVTFPVSKIEVKGSTVFKPAQFEPILKPLEGRSVSLEDLRNAADQITQLYLNGGYITSRAILVDQVIREGVVLIQVIEGSLEKIEVEGTQRLNPDYVRSRIKLGAKPPISTASLEDQLRLLKADPLFKNVEASLRPGSELGKSILVVRVQEAKLHDLNFTVDNYSPPSVGSERFGTSFAFRNLTGRGDQVAFSTYQTFTGGSSTYDLTYRLPVNAMNGTVQVRFAPNRNWVSQPPISNIFTITGKTDLYELSFRQPLIRSPKEELAVSIGFARQEGQTFINDIPFAFGLGPDITDGSSRTSVIKLGQDYVRRDSVGAWAIRSQLSIGTGLFGVTTNADPVPDGYFLSFLAQGQRVQVLNPNNLLIIQADLQLSADPLLPAQQFVIGGGQSVRGYRQNVRSGDNGFRLSIENRTTLYRDEAGLPLVQIAPFFDLGTVWNTGNNPNLLPDQTLIAAFGLGLIWQPLPGFNIRIDYAPPLIELGDRARNVQDNGFYFGVNYTPPW